MTTSAASLPASTTLEECLEILLAELELAIRWDRPSLLLAVYPTETIRQQAETALETRLRALGQNVQRLLISAEQFDIAWLLAQRADVGQTVFFVSGLRWGGGKDGGNAYRALNLRRELFVEHRARLVFWLTPQEATALPRRAPDFWAFRHRVVELPPPVPSLPPNVSPPSATGADAENAIALRTAMLASLPETAEAQATRLTLLLELVSLYRQRGEGERALALARQSVQLAEQTGHQADQARALLELGLTALANGDKTTAQQACQRAVALDAVNARAWESLGRVYHACGQSAAALQAWQKSLELDPHQADAWASLGDGYRAQGRLEEARRAYRKATHLAPDVASWWARLGETLFEAGNARAALRPLQKALQLDEQQVHVWELLARACEQLGRSRQAERARQRAQALATPPSPAGTAADGAFTGAANNPGD